MCLTIEKGKKYRLRHGGCAKVKYGVTIKSIHHWCGYTLDIDLLWNDYGKCVSHGEVADIIEEWDNVDRNR